MRPSVRSCLFVFALVVGGVVASGQSGPVRYTYDELGRLVGVTDQNGDTATYQYDAVGNLTGMAAGWAQVWAGNWSPRFGVPWGDAPYGDDPEDQEWIRMGIEYFRCMMRRAQR